MSLYQATTVRRLAAQAGHPNATEAARIGERV
jgi:hypothetical protein